MSNKETTSANKTQWGKPLVFGTVGLLLGSLLAGLVIAKVMPSMMIVTVPTQAGVDETVEALKASIEKNGWVVSGVRDLNKSLAKEGVQFAPKVRLVELCKPEYAKSVLSSDRFVSTMMPCTLAVWENEEGQTYLSKMNMGLMAKMFGGNIAAVMGGKVAADEKEILKDIIVH
jgi:uncharacterized protein (DUF302 family)